MDQNKSKMTEISCRITPLQNLFNPLSRLVATSLMILIGFAFVIFPVVNLLLYPYSIITWACALIFIPFSFRCLLRIDKIRSLDAKNNPDIIQIGNGFISSVKDGKSREIPSLKIRLSRGVFNTSILSYDVGYMIAVISGDVIKYREMKILISGNAKLVNTEPIDHVKINTEDEEFKIIEFSLSTSQRILGRPEIIIHILVILSALVYELVLFSMMFAFPMLKLPLLIFLFIGFIALILILSLGQFTELIKILGNHPYINKLAVGNKTIIFFVGDQQIKNSLKDAKVIRSKKETSVIKLSTGSSILFPNSVLSFEALKKLIESDQL